MAAEQTRKPYNDFEDDGSTKKKKKYDTKKCPSYQKWKAIAKERYHNDPEYRARKIEASKKYYRENYQDAESRMMMSVKRKEYYKRTRKTKKI